MGLSNNKPSAPPSQYKVKTKTERHLIQKQKYNRAVRKSLIYLLAIVMTTLVVDCLYFSGFTVTRSLALGAGLNWLTNAIFSKFVFRYSSAQAHRHMVSQFYRGQMVKWFLTLVGFALIFKFVRPINTLAVLIGYLSMLMAQSIVLIRIK